MPAVPPLRSLPPNAAVQVATREAGSLGTRLEAQVTGSPGYPVEVSRLMRGDTEVAEGGARAAGPKGSLAATSKHLSVTSRLRGSTATPSRAPPDATYLGVKRRSCTLLADPLCPGTDAPSMA